MPTVAPLSPVAGCCLFNGGMAATERLATLVVARRAQLGYRSRPPFAEAAGISLRTLGDIETGRRDRYDPGTIAAVEHALKWATGSVQAILEGGDPTEIDASRRSGHDAPAGVTPAERDEAIRKILTSNLSDVKKEQLILMLIAEKAAADRARAQRADDLIRILGDG